MFFFYFVLFCRQYNETNEVHSNFHYAEQRFLFCPLLYSPLLSSIYVVFRSNYNFSNYKNGFEIISNTNAGGQTKNEKDNKIFRCSFVFHQSSSAAQDIYINISWMAWTANAGVEDGVEYGGEFTNPKESFIICCNLP